MGPNPLSSLGYVAMLQSHDENGSQAAVRKALACQQQRGSTVTQSTYAGLTISAVSAPQTSHVTSAVLDGDGWVVLASDVNAAHAVVDRLGGKADTLAASPSFLNATRSLPANRFGTVFVNLRQLVASVGQGTAMGNVLPLVTTYPTAAGYLAWTAAGARAQVSLDASSPTGVGNLSGDTTGLAGLVPGDALAFAGVANLGGTLQADSRLLSSQTGMAGTVQQLLGVSPTEPALQQPAALAVLRSTGAGGAVFLLRAPDASAVAALLKRAAQTHGWTLKSMVVAGQPATALYSSDAGLLVNASPPSNVNANAGPVGASPRLVAVAAQVGGAFVLTGTTADMAAVMQTAESGAATLAQNAIFHQLVVAAPAGATSTTYIDVAGLQHALGAPMSPVSGNAGPQTTSLLITTVWTDTLSQVTIDATIDR
jgi:hypothetical protein